MSKKSGNDSQDLAQGVTKGLSDAGGKLLKGKNSRKMLGKAMKIAAKLMKSLIKKMIATIGKLLGTTVGPYVAVALVLIILLLLVMDSVKVFDIFQQGGERTAAEQLFDETVKDVMEEKQDDITNSIKETISKSQSSDPYEKVDDFWLEEAAAYSRISIAVPTINHYYKNLKNKSYNAWHSRYKNWDVSTSEKEAEVKTKFKKIISKGFDYYFDSEYYQPKYTYSSSEPEYKTVKTIKQCKRDTSGKDDKTVWGEKDTSTTKTKLKPHKVITGVSTIYNESVISYKTDKTDWSEAKTVESGNCRTTTQVQYELYSIDTSKSIDTTVSGTSLVTFLMIDAPEGKLSKLVKPQDLEYMIELGGEVDEAFPTLDINYKKLIACSKKKDLSTCIGKYVLGATPGNVNFGGGGGTISGDWYPGNYVELYNEAAKKCDVDWFVLASMHKQETEFSTNPVATDPTKGSLNAAGELVGAVGHMQFMPLTWIGWKIEHDPRYITTSSGNLIGDLDMITKISNIKHYGGYGLDANGNGIASPWEIEDAVVSASCYLHAMGYKKNNPESIKKALTGYGNGTSYANEVYARAMLYKDGKGSFGGGAGDIPVANGTFTFPTTGKITAGVGWYDYGNGNEWHYGLDIAGPEATIVAAADGVVSATTGHWSYGNVIRIKHNLKGKTYETLYAHMRYPTIRHVGEHVKKGDKLGVTGETGNVSGRHLHFEVHEPYYISQKATAKNPLKYIPKPPGN